MASIKKYRQRIYVKDDSGQKVRDADGKLVFTLAPEVWRARYRDADGKEHAKHFPRKVDAQQWLNEVTASIVTGQYVHPRAGEVTFKEYAEEWRKAAAHRKSTADTVRRHFTNHVYPQIGAKRLKNITPTHVKSLDRALGEKLAPSTVAMVHRFVSAVFASAVNDRKIAVSPSAKVSVPKIAPKEVTPIETDVVVKIRGAIPERYQALVTTAAGTGLRQGELFGLTVDRVDFLRKTVKVDRQLVSVAGATPEFGPLKTEASYRDVPLPKVVVDALAAHLAEFKAGPDGLIFTNSKGGPLRRSSFNDVWRAAAAEAKADDVVFHALRHYYASLLIFHGESVKVVQARLGHKSAQETLDTYSHLWKDDDERTREAVDEALGIPADSVRTGRGASDLRRRSEA